MNRTLYRLYLYVVAVAMLVFAAVSLGNLLTTLFLETPLRGYYESAPDSRAVAQSSVLAATALVVALGIGGLHYWLIRRDLAGDPSAGGGVVRALALNATQTVAALAAFFAGLTVLAQTGQPVIYGSLAGPLATLLVAAAVFAVAQWERARTQAGPGAALVLQRLHLYGVHSVILITAIFAVMTAVENTIHALLIQANAVPVPCADIRDPLNYPGCDVAAGLLGNWLALLWVVGAWAFYAWLARAEGPSIFRQLAHFLGFLVGLGTIVYGVERAAEWLLRAAFQVSDGMAIEYVQRYAFAGLVLFGTLVLLLYARRLILEGSTTRLGAQGTELTMLALAAVGLGIPFYIGVAWLGHGVVEAVFNGDHLAGDGWATGLALIIAGLAHPLLAYLLRVRSVGEAPIGPRRAYVFAGLAAGGLTVAISLSTALYLYITALIGSPVSDNWAANARYAVIALFVGAFIAGVHLWRLLHERDVLFPPHPASAPTPVPPTVPAGSGAIEAVLDELLAGRITRDQAAERLRALIASPGRAPVPDATPTLIA